MSRQVLWAVVVAVLLFGSGSFAMRAVDATSWLTVDGLRRAVGADAWYGPIGYVSTLVGAMFLPLPKIVLLGLGGALFGPYYGFAYAWLGQVLGMTVLFVIARSGFRGLVQRLVHEQMDLARRLDGHLERNGLGSVALLRLFYFMGTPLSVILSTTRLRLWHFVAGTALGVVPAIVLAVVSGDAVATGPTAIKAAIVGCGIVLVAGAGTVVRRRFEL